ncbi:MAG: ATP-binding protein [Marinilabiliaceae bacterium]|nr:ATP-binding protein [Marinilabiliaceae bacterium]
MQAFFKTHKYLLEHLEVPVRRKLMDEINWNHKLIGIKGARGIGKTSFLLNIAKEKYGFDKSCLYVNLNNLYFSGNSIIGFADEFRKTGGKTLILDQVFKYPSWLDELKYCYDHFTDLQVVFSGSSAMSLVNENSDLSIIADVYSLEGFSFREFINLKAGTNFEVVPFDNILRDHENIANNIVKNVKPLAFFSDYLHHGYYPFYLEQSNYLENLLKIINFSLEIDVSYLQQIDLKYLPKIRKLLYIIGLSAPFQPNISRISAEIETSRATVMNYLTYLKQAKLIHLLYEGDDELLKKPSMVYMQNPNIVYSVAQSDIEINMLHQTFFYSMVSTQKKFSYTKQADFLVDGHYKFLVGGRIDENKKRNRIEEFCARDMIEVGEGNQIPLWLFGFLY